MTIRDLNDLPSPIHPKVVELYRRPFFKQGTQEWLEQRRSFLTASDVGAVLGTCIFKNRDAVRGLKLGTIPLGAQTAAMKHGTDTEPEARAVYEKMTGNRVIQFGLLTGSHFMDFLGASVDGITTEGIVVEIKCPYSRKIKSGEIPEYYYDQVQSQLAVCELDIAHYFEYNSIDGTTNLVVVERDPNWETKNKRTLMDFWANIESEQKLSPYISELNEDKKNDFLSSVWIPKYADIELARLRGDMREVSTKYTELGIACCDAGYGHYQRAVGCFIDAEKAAIPDGWLYEFVQANLNRALVYSELGMKWYGVPLLLYSLVQLEGVQEKTRDEWMVIAQFRKHLGYAYTTWVMGHEQDSSSLALGRLMYLTANELCQLHGFNCYLGDAFDVHEQSVMENTDEQTAQGLLAIRSQMEEIMYSGTY